MYTDELKKSLCRNNRSSGKQFCGQTIKPNDLAPIKWIDSQDYYPVVLKGRPYPLVIVTSHFVHNRWKSPHVIWLRTVLKCFLHLKLLVVVVSAFNVHYKNIERLAITYRFFRDPVYDREIVALCGRFCSPARFTSKNFRSTGTQDHHVRPHSQWQ